MFTTGLYTRLLQACDINSECKLQTCHRLVLICLLSQACVHMQACGRPVYLACHLLVLQACKEHVTVLLLVSLKLVTSLKFYHLATFWFTIRDCTVFSIRVHQLEQYQHLKKEFLCRFLGLCHFRNNSGIMVPCNFAQISVFCSAAPTRELGHPEYFRTVMWQGSIPFH